MKKLALLCAVLTAVACLAALPPEYDVSIQPTLIRESWYDFMMGSYNNLPMQELPSQFGGGRFFTYHARLTQTGLRKVWFGYINDAGLLAPMDDPWIATSVYMGYPALSVDRELGKPFYAWHMSNDADTEYEIAFMYDMYPQQTPGIYSSLQYPFDPPNTPPGHENDEFLWATLQTGPSPNPGMRRVYVMVRNYAYDDHPSENVLIAYADYNEAMLMADQSFTWSYTSIPQLDDWHQTTEPVYRRPAGSLAVGDDGRIYYAGLHYARDADSELIDEPDIDVFVCDNYGAGTWQYYSASSKVPSYNPWNPFLMRHAFYDDAEEPIPDEQIYYQTAFVRHFNISLDSDGKLHIPNIWSLRIGDPNLQYRLFSTIKEAVFDTATHTFEIREIYPKAGNSIDDIWWMPWDGDGDHQADNWPLDQLQPEFTYNFPYCHWDETLHFDAMIFHYGNLHISEDDGSGAMVCLWEDSYKARCYNLYPADYPQYQPWGQAPEVMISVSPDRGLSWSDPIVLSSVDTPELAGMIPMWVYPSDRMQSVNSGGNPAKRLWLMFMDDYDWGTTAITPTPLPPNRGDIMYMALDIQMPPSAIPDEPLPGPETFGLSNYPNPFNPSTTITYELAKAGRTRLAVYNLRGQMVNILSDEQQSSGTHKIVWDGQDSHGRSLSSGVYLLKLETDGKTALHRMMLVK